MVVKLSAAPLTLPVTTDWMNGFIAALWPLLRAAVNRLIKVSIVPQIKKKLPSFLQESFDINPCNIGSALPKLKPVRFLEKRISGGWLDLEMGIEYDGDADIEIALCGKKVGVKEIKISAQVFISFYGFTPKPPFFHGISMYMIEPCQLDLEWGGLLQFFDMTFIEDIVRSCVNQSLGRMMVLPNRFAFPLLAPTEANVLDMMRPKPRGLLQIRLLAAERLAGTEWSMSTLVTGDLTSDPYVTVSLGAETWRSSTLWNTCNPKWEIENAHTFVVDIPERERMHIQVFDDGVHQKLRTAANVEKSEAHEIARTMNLSIMDILGRCHDDPLTEEILVERWIGLDSWWPSRGMGTFMDETAAALGELTKDQPVVGKVAETLGNMRESRFRETGASIQERLQKVTARVRIRAHWRRVGEPWEQTTLQERQCSAATGAVTSVVPDVSPVQQLPDSLDTGSVASSEESNDDPDWEGWPDYVLRVGIESVERLPCNADETEKVFFAECETFPIVNDVGKEVSQSVQGVSALETKHRGPTKTSIAGIGKTQEESELLARKIGRLLEARVPEEVMASVLEVDPSQVRKLLGRSFLEQSGRRDVSFNECFMYYLRAEHLLSAEVNVQVYSQASSKSPRAALGGIQLSLIELFDADGLFLERRRAPLNGAVNACITVVCQMWPVMRSATPVDDLIERAVAHERHRMRMEAIRFKAEISVFSARRLPNVNAFGRKSDPYCICTLEGVGRPKQVLKTHVIDNDSDPDWNHGPEMVEWTGETTLRFQVFDRDISRRGALLGEAAVSREECAQGLYTDLDLGNGTSFLNVKVCPICESGPLDVPYSVPKPVTKLRVCIEKAQGLRGVNWQGGKSDPYVVCRLSHCKTFKTPVIHDELNPHWSHGPVELTLGKELALSFDVRDKDTVGSTSIGTAELTRYKCLAGFEDWLRLGKGNGRLFVRIEPVKSEGNAAKPVKLQISVLGASNLHTEHNTFRGSNPYVICSARGKERFRTEAIRNNLTPRWDPRTYPVELRLAENLQFQVYDKGLFSKGDLLGTATIGRNRCERGFDGNLDLGPGKGTLQVRIACDD